MKKTSVFEFDFVLKIISKNRRFFVGIIFADFFSEIYFFSW